MGCNFCKKIWNSMEEYQKQFQHRWDEEISIVKDDDDGNIGLYVPCNDYYYSDIIMDINYCPICGRKL